MNTPADNDDDNLRYAEYVLGVLDADARAAVAREIQSTDEAAAAVALWQRRLTPLAREIAEAAPAPHVWARIQNALQLDAPARVQPRKGIWENLPLWRWIGIGASVVAAASIVLMVTYPRLPPAPVAVSAGYMVSAIQQDNGVTGWTATTDLQRSRMVVVPATPVVLAQGRAPELWLIPAGQKPIAVGMITRDKPTTLALAPALLAQLGPTAVLAVSVEPVGGSPTGQPTGPVIAKGAISGKEI
ncbi:MAG TPA: anti-sigma factor [Steroidobacteraceae bacterium]